jgi:hypothetical protein
LGLEKRGNSIVWNSKAVLSDDHKLSILGAHEFYYDVYEDAVLAKTRDGFNFHSLTHKLAPI